MNSPETNGCIRNLLACQFEVRRLIKLNAELVESIESLLRRFDEGNEPAGGVADRARRLIDKAGAL